MLGGYQIIDLRKVGLEMKQTQQSFTNAEILDQLRSLRALIQKGHDYTKPLSNSQKPILIRYRDAKNGEKAEVCGYADIISTNASLTYEIKTKNLQIEVVFEEKTNDDGVKYYDIKTAKYYYNENESIEGKLTVGGDLSVGGDIEGEGKITADEIVENMTGYSGSLYSIPGITVEDVYASAVKNGNKITFVFAGSVTKATGYSGGSRQQLIKFKIPSSIGTKLYPIPIGINILDVKNISCITEGFTSVDTIIDCEKYSNTELAYVIAVGSLVEETKYFIRYEVTFLLSDNLISNE